MKYSRRSDAASGLSAGSARTVHMPAQVTAAPGASPSPVKSDRPDISRAAPHLRTGERRHLGRPCRPRRHVSRVRRGFRERRLTSAQVARWRSPEQVCRFHTYSVVATHLVPARRGAAGPASLDATVAGPANPSHGERARGAKRGVRRRAAARRARLPRVQPFAGPGSPRPSQLLRPRHRAASRTGRPQRRGVRSARC